MYSRRTNDCLVIEVQKYIQVLHVSTTPFDIQLCFIVLNASSSS